MAKSYSGQLLWCRDIMEVVIAMFLFCAIAYAYVLSVEILVLRANL
jgi:hypothetical protein